MSQAELGENVAQRQEDTSTSNYWSDHVADLAPYTPGEQPRVDGLLKLNTNEHPYGPSPRVLEAIRTAADNGLRLYPDYDSVALRQAVAALHGIDPAQVFPGNGSDEVLAHIFDGLFRKAGRALLMPDISYSFYKTYCRLYRIDCELVPLAEDFSIRASDYVSHGGPLAGIIFANPNAPTGMEMTQADIESILRAHPGVPVVVDEAYVDFGARSAVPLLARYPNLLVVHTLSKSRALAGLRVGYALGGVELVEGLRRIKDSFNSYPLDRLAQAGAVASIEDREHFEQGRRAVIEAREELTRSLAAMGFEVLPSRANFVFARHPGRDATRLAAALREQRILVRHFKTPRIDQFLRISVGTPADCGRLCSVLAAILGSS